MQFEELYKRELWRIRSEYGTLLATAERTSHEEQRAREWAAREGRVRSPSPIPKHILTDAVTYRRQRLVTKAADGDRSPPVVDTKRAEKLKLKRDPCPPVVETWAQLRQQREQMLDEDHSARVVNPLPFRMPTHVIPPPPMPTHVMPPPMPTPAEPTPVRPRVSRRGKI